MKADYIEKITKRLNDLPYEAILFDGKWGIGKSYAINAALEKNDNVCKISMFGLADIKQIYHEVLFQLALKNNTGGKIGEIANNVLEGLSTVWGRAAQAKELIHSIANERELFLLLSKEFDSPHIIVIDDLERMSNHLRLEEVLGIIEELKQCNYVKIIVVANMEEFSEESKEVFKKYNEKVIDRIYHITELPEKVMWSKMKIHAAFVEKFLQAHKVKNLRTLEKAQNLFSDVKLYCKGDMSEQFLDEIRLICFAIVVEDTDKLYYREPDENESDPMKKSSLVLNNRLEHRIINYLSGIKSSRNLVTMILQYYKNEIMINEDGLNAEYKIFSQAGQKSNYYKTDEEIRKILPDLRKEMNNAHNLAELNKFADEYVMWSDILEEENESILQEYKEILHKMLEDMVLEGKEEVLNYGYDLFNLSSEKVKKIYSEENLSMKNFVVKTYIEYLQKVTSGRQAFEYSYKLRKYFDNSFYRETVKELSVCLYNSKSFPIDEMDDERYHTCYNIMYVLYHSDEDKFFRYCDELKLKCDHMSGYRLEDLVKELIKGY